MTRIVAGILLLIGMGAGTVFAKDGWRNRSDIRRDIRRDEAKIAKDQRELRRALHNGNYAAARRERKELRREYRDVSRDRRELNWERR